MNEAENEGTPADKPPEEAQTSRLARASLWFGIASLLAVVPGFFVAVILAGQLVQSQSCPFWSAVFLLLMGLCPIVPAVVCGWAALARIRRSGGRLRGRGRAVVGVVMGCLGLAFATFMAHEVAVFAESMNRLSCQGNLKFLGSALGSYASAHEYHFPESLSAFHEEMPCDLRFYVCPSVGGDPPSPDRIDEEGSYVYAGAGHKLTGAYDRDVSTIPIMWDKPGNHGGEGVNVLYLDGHTEWREEVPRPVPPPEQEHQTEPAQ